MREGRGRAGSHLGEGEVQEERFDQRSGRGPAHIRHKLGHDLLGHEAVDHEAGEQEERHHDVESPAGGHDAPPRELADGAQGHDETDELPLVRTKLLQDSNIVGDREGPRDRKRGDRRVEAGLGSDQGHLRAEGAPHVQGRDERRPA